MYNQELGKQGEDFACTYVKGKGMEVLARNFRGRGGEIDVIARDGETVAFIEVKTRTGTAYGSPAEAVTYFKMRRIRSTAQEYIMKKRLYGSNFRFDVAEVFRNQDGFVINYIKNAF